MNKVNLVSCKETQALTKCHVLTPEGILCTRNDCCSMVCSHTMAVCCTLKTNMILFVLFFFPHLEILGGSQFGYFNFFPYLWFLGGSQLKKPPCSNWWNRVETGKHRQRWIFPSYQGVQIKGLIFSCPSSSIPTSLIHLLCWIQLPNLDQTIPTLKLTFFLPYFLSSLLQKTFSTI